MNPEVPRFHPFPSKTTVERSIANHEIDFPELNIIQLLIGNSDKIDTAHHPRVFCWDKSSHLVKIIVNFIQIS